MSEKVDSEQITKQSNKALIWTGIIIAVFIAALLTNGFGLFGKGVTGSTVNKGEYTPLAIGNSPVLGDINAPITIYEFSDFSCPYCAAASDKNDQITSSLKAKDPDWEAPLPKITEEYVNNGKVKIVFKYFPGHGSGNAAHLVGWALNEQGLFWEFHDLAFENQEKTGDLAAMKALAEQIGADMDKLNSDIDSGKYSSYFDEDQLMGQSNGVSGTPFFFINGQSISGAQPFYVFKRTIDKLL